MILPGWKKYKKTQKGKGFDQNKANAAIDFIQHYLTHTKGRWAGEKFKLLPWQIELLTELFGRVNKDGNRQYRTCYVEICKKNGKSELAAGIALYLQVCDGEKGAEIYSAAADRDQAAIVFNVAAQMVRNDDDLTKALKIIDSQKRIVDYKTGNVYRVLSSEIRTKHGINAHGMVFDELHAQPNRELWDTLTYGSGLARTQPLIFAITTAGFDRNSICWELHERGRRIMKGLAEERTFLPVIYALEEDDDWEDRKNWLKVNPSAGTIFDIDSLKDDYQLAKEIPAQENEFKRKRLDLWTRQETRWIPLDKWDACPDKINLDALKGRPCYGGLDLASTTDIAAFVLVFPPEDERNPYILLPFFWIPEESMEIRSRRDKVDYDIWCRQKLIKATPGNVIDYRFILHTIEEALKLYDIKEIAFDRWGATKVMQDLQEMGFENVSEEYANRQLIQFGQGYKSMSPPTKELLKLILSGRINHGGNIVLRWMADNMVVTIDPTEAVKPEKAKSTERIDGMVAAIMGLDRALKHVDRGSKYETEGLTII